MSVKRAGIGVGVAVPGAVLLGVVFGSPPVALAVVAGALVVGWRRIPRFWRSVARGLVAGGLAGALVLGPGFRLVMRIVAIVDPVRRPEFTLEGTMFLVVMVGLIFGAITAGWTVLVATALRLPRWGGAGLITLATIFPLFSDSEVLRELNELGAGPWVNVPMFLGVTVLYAYLADRWARPVTTPETEAEPAVIEAASLA
jgi:hypothetical protein